MLDNKEKKVLIIDDENLVRRALRKAFQAHHFIVFDADSGIPGLQLWSQVKPDFVVLDIVMPDLNGFEVLKKAQALGLVSSHVILISAFSEMKIEDSGLQWPSLEFMPKPFENVFKIVELCENKIKRSLVV